MRTTALLAFTIVSVCTFSSCNDLPPRLVDEPNPVDHDEQVNKFFFREMYKSGVFKTSKEMMDIGRTNMRSGRLHIGEPVAPIFYARNAGGPLKGLRVTVSGSAIDKGMLAKPQVIISNGSFQPLLAAFLSRWMGDPEPYREAVKKADYSGTPTTETINGTVWVVDAPDFELDRNAQIRIAMNCEIAKAGSTEFAFNVYSLNNPAQSLISHLETLSVNPKY